MSVSNSFPYIETGLKVLSSIGVRVISDNIIFYFAPGNITVEGSASLSPERNKAIGYCLQALFMIMSNCYCKIIATTGRPLRGGVSIGFGYESERESFLFGLSEALNNAVMLERRAENPKVLLDQKLSEYLDEVEYTNKNTFFYRDEHENLCFDWYAGLSGFSYKDKWFILTAIKNNITENASAIGKDKNVIEKLLYFAGYHNRKVQDSTINCPEIQINIGQFI
jgi:hypothetical protein